MPQGRPPSRTPPKRTSPLWRRSLDSHWAINTTIRCQHRCVYCFEGDRHGLKDIPCAETKALLDQAAREVPAVIFMGAEPTLNPHLPELVRYATDLGLGASISTNALRLADWDYLMSLHKAGLKNIEFSFHYPDEKVYSRITRAAPAGFARLLKALDNIARWQREFVPPGRARYFQILPAVNLVVSRFNVDRLEEVLGHLAGHLDEGRYVVTCKRLDMAPVLHEESFRRSMYVPLADLRRCLSRLAPQAAAGVKLGFRDFPLCAIPGLERLDYDLGYWLNDVRVRQNFFRQGQMVDMYPEESHEAQPFDWICEDCSLSPLCRQRYLFLQADSSPEHAPRPLSGALPEPLAAWVGRQPRGAAVLRAPRRRTARGWALGSLLKASPPERPLAGKTLFWAPLERGVIRLSAGTRSTRLSLDRDGEGTWRLVPAQEGLPAWAEPGRARLQDLLRRLPAPPPDCLPEPALRPTALPPYWGNPAGARAPSGKPAARPKLPPRWDGFVGGLFLERWLAAAGREPALREGRLEPSAGGLIRAHGPQVGDEGEFVVTPRDGPKSYGFLCGPLRLQADWLGSGASGLLWLKAAYAAGAELEARRAWPSAVPRREDSFLARAWRIFGAGLAPRAGARSGLLGGWVSDEGIQLDLVKVEGRPYGILLVPEALAQKPYACGHGISLQYAMPQGLRDESRWLAIVDAYARVLTGGKTPERGPKI
ncbi:MAG: radical SAM protein [Elusimicrobia bacterium]|nr:radical SAM protein [Elusimicrobiota bacterium]